MTGQTLTDSNITLGQGVAAVVGGTVRTVGTVAGTAVAAPLTIVEQPAHRPADSDVGATLREDQQSKPLTQ
jgi:esterase/lipase superfamily enzyme